MKFIDYLIETGVVQPYDGNPKKLKGLSLGYQFFSLPSPEKIKWRNEHPKERISSLGYLGYSDLSILQDSTYLNPIEFADTVEELGQLMGGS